MGFSCACLAVNEEDVGQGELVKGLEWDSTCQCRGNGKETLEDRPDSAEKWAAPPEDRPGSDGAEAPCGV